MNRILHCTPSVNPSVMVPMKNLFHDEKYTGENIQILQRLAKEARITGNPQEQLHHSDVLPWLLIACIPCVCWDQATCKNIRGAKKWTSNKISNINRLEWANQTPGIILHLCTHMICVYGFILSCSHFLWECLRVIFDCYWGKTTQHGPLVSLRELISRNKVDKAVKSFSIEVKFLTRVSSTSLGTVLYASSQVPIAHHNIWKIYHCVIYIY